MRDKNISIRVDSRLYNEFLKIVDSKTEIYYGYGSRKIYHYRDSFYPYHYDKFTAADLFECALKDYIDKHRSANN